MRTHGICYDTGFFNAGGNTHEPFDPELVAREMRVIHDDLHCDAVRITGGDAGRLKTAATAAAEAGLEVWLCPFTNELPAEELLALLADCAAHAETLRAGGAELVMATGSELSIMLPGLLPGTGFADRVERIRQARADGTLPRLIGPMRTGLARFLDQAVDTVRSHFHGRVTYCSLPLEGVDWSKFDIISTDAGYRDAELAAGFADAIREFAAQDKFTAITEFGCATYQGAADDGSRSHFVVRWDGPRIAALDGEYVRDETEPARYLTESLRVFDEAGVDATFLYEFAARDFLHRPDDPAQDWDIAAPSVVKMLDGDKPERYPDMPWEPKRAFDALAEYYRAGEQPSVAQ